MWLSITTGLVTHAYCINYIDSEMTKHGCIWTRIMYSYNAYILQKVSCTHACNDSALLYTCTPWRGATLFIKYFTFFRETMVDVKIQIKLIKIMFINIIFVDTKKNNWIKQNIFWNLKQNYFCKKCLTTLKFVLIYFYIGLSVYKMSKQQIKKLKFSLN